jgi:superfamily II DNA/RNA helicase
MSWGGGFLSSLLDDLRRVPTPLSVKSRSPLVASVKGAQLALLKAAIGRAQGRAEKDLAPGLRRYAIWLEYAAFVNENSDESISEVAAALYEFAAYLTDIRPSTIFKPPLNDLLRSAIVASQTTFQGRSSIVARRIVNSLLQQESDTAEKRCHIEASLVVASLLARRFHIASSRARGLDQIAEEGLTELESRDATAAEYEALDLAVRIAHAAANAASGMLAGVPLLLDAALEQFDSLREVAVDNNDSDRFWLCDRLAATVRRMNESSMHRLLGHHGSPIPPRYRHMLAREGFFELWGPQREALERGIINPSSHDNFVISVPTGAGKTLLAELLILTTLGGDAGWVVYITPSRSLVNQVSQDLRRRLQPCDIHVQTILAGAEQSIVLDEELEFLPRTRSVVVTTPEKLDSYYRNAQQIFDSCRLLIVDEAHKVSEARRGPLIESIVARFKVLQPNTRIALLSGVMSNAEELSSWLGDDSSQTVVSRRRATRHTFGVAIKQDQPITYGPEKPKKDKDTKQPKISRRVNFKGGIVLVDEEDDISGDITVDLVDVFNGYTWERLRKRGWFHDRQEAGSPITDHSIEIAQAFAAAPGTILVFFNDTRWVESASRDFFYTDTLHADERKLLSDFLSLELGASHDLPKLCLRGVAYHHSRLPVSVQRAIELALERGWLKIVFATATLREGINTPATTVIVGGLTYRDQSGSTPITAMDFANLAGRAGRPRTDTEGRVILVPNSLAEASAIEAAKEYVLSGDAARKVRSQLRKLKDELEKADGEITKMPIDEQRLLLGLKAVDLSDSDGVSSFLDSTLWSFQELDEQSVRRAATLATKAFVQAEELIGERLAVASKVGLSLTSSELLRAEILERTSVFARSEAGDGTNRDEQIRVLLYSSLLLEEVNEQIDKADRGVEIHLPPLLAWINGENYDSVLLAGKESGLFGQSAKAGAAVKHCADLSNWLSWSFGAGWAIVEAELDDPDPAVGILPLMIRYGVPTDAAAFLSLLGVADRNAALVLSERFDDTGQKASLQSISDWMEEVEVEDVFPLDRHHLRAELLRRQAFRFRRPPLPYEFAAFRSDRVVDVGTVLSLESAARRVFVILNRQVIGEVGDEELPEVLHILADSSRPPYVVVVDSASPAKRGTFVIIQ